jgi:hypothetical protein
MLTTTCFLARSVWIAAEISCEGPTAPPGLSTRTTMARMPSFSANSRSSLRVVFPSAMTPSTSTTPTRSPLAKLPLRPLCTAAQARARKANRERNKPPKTRPMIHAARRSMVRGF